MNSMKRKKDMIVKDELPRSVGAQYAIEKSGEITPESKEAEPKQNNAQLWMWLVTEVKPNAAKNNTA